MVHFYVLPWVIGTFGVKCRPSSICLPEGSRRRCRTAPTGRSPKSKVAQNEENDDNCSDEPDQIVHVCFLPVFPYAQRSRVQLLSARSARSCPHGAIPLSPKDDVFQARKGRAPRGPAIVARNYSSIHPLRAPQLHWPARTSPGPCPPAGPAFLRSDPDRHSSACPTFRGPCLEPASICLQPDPYVSPFRHSKRPRSLIRPSRRLRLACPITLTWISAMIGFS
jgi:hypothetical protein